MFKPKIKFFFVISLLTVSLNCKDIHQVYPQVSFSISLDTNTELANLGIGSSVVCPKGGGYMGIIIYREDMDVYHAYERTCSYFPNDTSAVVLDKSGIIAECPKCGSKFLIAGGALVNKGPAQFPLREYRTYLDASNRLFISN